MSKLFGNKKENMSIFITYRYMYFINIIGVSVKIMEFAWILSGILVQKKKKKKKKKTDLPRLPRGNRKRGKNRNKISSAIVHKTMPKFKHGFVHFSSAVFPCFLICACAHFI